LANLLYDPDYYDCDVENPAIRSVETMSESIYDGFKPKSIIDVGCGTGALLDALRKRGCEVCGLEYAEAALRLCRAQHLPVLKFNLERDVFTDQRVFDVAISMEVAEHLPARVADRYIRLLTRLSSVIVFTAAPPGQGGRVGTDHVNEQPPSYWIAKFHQRGFEHHEVLSRTWLEK
jgi:SAM-dependent methyltransferase